MSKITNINIQGTEYDVVDADARTALDVLATAVDGKQATLTAGNGIDITNNTISVDKIQAVTSLPTTSTNGNLVLYKGSSGSIVSYTQIAFDPTDTEHFDYDIDDEVYYFNNGQFFVKIDNEYYPANIASENNGTIILRMTGEALAEPYDNNLYIENYVELTQGTIYEYNNGSWTAVMSESSGSSVTVDSTLDTTSSNPIANSAVATALNSKQATLTFDSAPTQNSTNPVTSGGVYTALSGKQATLTFDSTPTNGSTNPVTSGGVYAALQNVTGATGANGEDGQDAHVSLITTYDYTLSGTDYTAQASAPAGATNVVQHAYIKVWEGDTEPADSASNKTADLYASVNLANEVSSGISDLLD